MTQAKTTRPVRWGILGTAKIASKVARAIHLAQGAQLVAVASRDLSRAATWADRHGPEEAVSRQTDFDEVRPLAADDATSAAAPGDESRRSDSERPQGTSLATFGSYLELLRCPDIDAVYIPLPPSLHCEWTCAAAQHGKHVLCEKPLAMNFAEAERMIDSCQTAQRQLMDGVMWKHHDRTSGMQAVLASGELGRLRKVTSAFSFHATELGPGDIRFQRELGGGALGDLGWYCIGAILWAFGELPERVFATARYERDVDMNLSALLWFSGERMASFDCGFDTAFRKWFEISGTDGSIVCDDFVNPWDTAKARFWVHSGYGKSAQHDHGGCIQEVRMIENFCEIVRSGRIDPAWPQAALATQKVCDTIARAARTGKIVELDRR